MSICYYLGSRSGKAKKSGNWFGCTTILFCDQYNNPTTEVIFWESEEQFDSSDVMTAQEFYASGEAVPIICNRAIDGKRLASLTVHDSVPSLDIRPLLGCTV